MSLLKILKSEVAIGTRGLLYNFRKSFSQDYSAGVDQIMEALERAEVPPRAVNRYLEYHGVHKMIADVLKENDSLVAEARGIVFESRKPDYQLMPQKERTKKLVEILGNQIVNRLQGYPPFVEQVLESLDSIGIPTICLDSYLNKRGIEEGIARIFERRTDICAQARYQATLIKTDLTYLNMSPKDRTEKLTAIIGEIVLEKLKP
jgi:hypothetical protein